MNPKVASKSAHEVEDGAEAGEMSSPAPPTGAGYYPIFSNLKCVTSKNAKNSKQTSLPTNIYEDLP
jgi:hypothetical protein